MSLRGKLLLSFLVIILPMLGLILYGFETEYERRKRVILDEQMRTAQAVAAFVDATFDDSIDLAWSLASNPLVRTFDPNVIDPYLMQLNSHYPQYEVLGAFNAHGESVGTSLPYAPGQARINTADRPHFKQVMATNSPVVSEVLESRRTSRPTIIIAVPIRDDSGKAVGEIVLSVFTNYLPERLTSIQLAPEQNIGLADHNGRLAFFTSRPELTWERRDVSNLPAFIEARSGIAVKVEEFEPLLLSGPQLGAFTPTPKYGWVVGITTPVDTALAPAREAFVRNFGLFGGVVFLSLLSGLVLARQLVGPLKKLTLAVVAFGKGELPKPVSLNTGDEIDELARAFNNMSRDLAERMTENTRLMRELEHKAAQLESTIESMADGVFMVVPEGDIIHVNYAAVQMLGYADSDEFPKSLAQLNEVMQIRRADGTPIPLEEMSTFRAVQKGETSRGEERLVRGRNGEDLYVSISASPVRSNDQSIIMAVAVIHDVTQIKRLERMKDEFLSVAAHELKTPVTAIKGYAQLMKQWAPEGHDPREGKAINTINRQCNRLNRLINELLEVSRLQLGGLELYKEEFDLVEAAREIANRVEATTNRHRFVFNAVKRLPITADHDRIEQVLLNLLDNAVKFSPSGGDIEISVTVADGESIVSVTDHGIGIPQGREQAIFERFYRAHAGTHYDYGGMGMGLYIAKEIIEKHGGRIWFASEEEVGTTFSFSLPLAGGPKNGAR